MGSAAGVNIQPAGAVGYRAARVAVIAEVDTRRQLHGALVQLGHQIVPGIGEMLVPQIIAAQPDLAIVEVLPPRMDQLQIVDQLHEDARIPSLLIAADSYSVPLDRLPTDHVLALLTWPVRLADLGAAIALGLGRFQRLQAMVRETALLREALHRG